MSVLRISPRQTSFSVRGFTAVSPGARSTLEAHGASFVRGYNSALSARTVEALGAGLDMLPAAERGFAYEGAGMALAVLDLLPGRKRDRLVRLLHGPGEPHVYMLHVGAGWAVARLHLQPARHLPGLDPFLRWLVLDGYGFHEGFFHTRRAIDEQKVPRRLAGYAGRAHDQGLGRSLWFVFGADVERAASVIARFPEARRADLWSGLALAATYTAVAGADELELVRELGGDFPDALRQGAAFAIAARHRAGNLIPTVRLAARLLCERTVEEVVEVVQEARQGLTADPDGYGYEEWRRRIGARLLHTLPSAAA